MLKKEEFFEKYKISYFEFDKAKINWDDLLVIFNHYKNKLNDLDITGNSIVNSLRHEKYVHSLKFRIKDPEHLIEKIIRKKMSNPNLNIDVTNYLTKITDLVGIRALHLFKEDWFAIHDFIRTKWELLEEPVANVRIGDSQIKSFEDRGLKINNHQHGYRSLHYIIATTLYKDPILIEIQVRTIFEEGWSEIDHLVRYPYDQDNALLKNYINVFNRIAGTADEMGSFLKYLKAELDKDKNNFSNYKITNLSSITNIEKLLKDIESSKEIKYELESELNNLKKNIGMDHFMMIPKEIFLTRLVKFPELEVPSIPLIDEIVPPKSE